MRWKRIVLTLALLLVVVGLGRYVLRQAAPDPTPPSIVRATTAASQVPAGTTDAASSNGRPHLDTSNPASSADRTARTASEAFVRARECVFSQREKHRIDMHLSLCEQHESLRGDPAQASLLASCDARLDAIAKRLDVLASSLSHCPDVDQEAAEHLFFERTRDASRAGVADAQLCYVSARFALSRAWTETEQRAYAREARHYVALAMQRGDWRFAELLRSRTLRAGEDNRLFLQLSAGDQATRYRYNRLLRLGAVSRGYQRYLDDRIDDGLLSLHEKRAAEAWAQRTYADHFSNAARLTTRPDTCLASRDDLDIAWLSR